MKIPFAIFLCLMSCIPSMAFDLEKINSSLTRAASDDLFSKDYNYKVLADLSVRRSWSEGNRMVQLEYDVASDKLISAEVKYKEIVPVATALRDAAAMAGKDLPADTWKAVGEKQAEEIGMETARYVRLADGSYVIIELPVKGKVSYLSFFSKQPKDNRRLLEEANRVYKTGFGVNPNASAASSLYDDEENRKTGKGASISMSSSSSTTSASRTSPTLTVTTGSSGAKGGSGKTISWSSKDPVNTDSGATKTQKEADSKAEPIDELKKDGAWYKSLSAIEWGGILLLVVIGLGFLFNSVSSANRAEKLVADKKKRDALVRQQRVKMGVKQGRRLK